MKKEKRKKKINKTTIKILVYHINKPHPKLTALVVPPLLIKVCLGGLNRSILW